jgi:hypothetical protein
VLRTTGRGPQTPIHEENREAKKSISFYGFAEKLGKAAQR